MDTKVAAMEGTEVGLYQPLRLLNIKVLMGGPSSEREVSLASGSAIAEGLGRVGHTVSRSDIVPEDVSALEEPGIDVVFIALHGAFGESGEVQRLCEQRGLRYTGSGPKASELAMDKAAAKEVLRRAGLATPDWVVVKASDARRHYRKAVEALGLPVVLKPVDGGSSVDVTIARDEARRGEATQALLGKYGLALLERFVRGAELTVGILGDRALPVIQIVPARSFYDYTAKYADDTGTQYLFAHGLPEATVRAAQAAALKTHQALGCRHMSRVDFILAEDGQLQVLESNTIPGFTGHSLLPKAAAQAGIGFEELVDRIANMAVDDL